MAVDLQLLTAGLTITALLVIIFRIGGMTRDTQPLVANQHIVLATCLFASLFVPASYVSPLILFGLLVFFWVGNHRWKAGGRLRAPDDTLRPSSQTHR